MKKLPTISYFHTALFATLFLSFASCDDVKVDPDNLTTAGIKSNTIYVRASSSSLIDLSSKVSTSQAVNFSITSSTNKGNLSSMGNGLLQYSPNQGITNARDAFSYTLSNQNNEVLKKDSVIIVVESDSTNLPAGIYPADDILFGITPNTSVTIDVLKNDILAPYTSADFNLSIYRPEASFPPYAGTAVVVGNSITYTAQANFTEADKFVYKLELKSNPAITAFGLVYLARTQGCSFSLTDDRFISNEPFSQLVIPVLSNDALCNAINNYSVVISKQPLRGRAYMEAGSVVYQPNQIAENGFTDSLQYKVTLDGTSKTALVIVGVNTSLPSVCQLTVVTDLVDIRNTPNSTVLIDVLQNDILCNANVVLQIENSPVVGTASVVVDAAGNKKISYVPNPSQPVADDKFIYRITAGDKTALGGVVIKRVN